MQPPKVSIFIRSYAKDRPWLEYCLQLLEQRADVSDITVVIPRTDEKAFADFHWRGVWVQFVDRISPDGYVDQQASKCYADRYCGGDFILHVDSDMLLTRTLDLGSYFEGGKPKLIFRRWEECGTAICWRQITKDALRAAPQFEFMPCCGIVYHRSTHELFRRYIEGVHGTRFDAFIKGRPHRYFSEFNALGNFSHLFTPDAYSFVRCQGPGVDSYPRPFRQFFSHDGVEKHREEIERILA